MIDLKNLRREMDIKSAVERSSLPAIGQDDFVAQPERKSESSSSNAASPALVPGKAEGSTGYRILALLVMLALAAGALVFLLYLRS